jgi:hypothetical protein
MAGKVYTSTTSFKPPQNKLPTKPKVSYTVSVDNSNNEGITRVFRYNEDGTNEIIGTYPKRDPQSSTGNFERTNSATDAEFNYFFANGNSVITTYAAPLVTNEGDNPNQVLGTNFAIAPTASLSTNAAASSGDPNISAAVDNPQDIDPLKIQVGTSQGRKNFGSYVYPIDLASNKQDRIIFTLKEIKGSKITPTFDPKKKVIDRTGYLERIDGQVTLPIQSGITDSNSVDWSGSSLNAIQAYAAGASLKFINSEDASDLGNNVSTILGDIAKKIKDNKEYGEALKLYLAQEAVGVQGLLSRASGAILNPNLELLFNGPQLRPFNFTFRLSPREEKEATQVRSIIRFFKEAMSVKTSTSNVFLKSPFVFDIKYVTYDNNGNVLPDGGHHPSISRIKTCALLSCDVDYTPDGSYMTFNDGTRTMTSYGLSLRFSELEPIYSTDYTDEKIAVDHIGY